MDAIEAMQVTLGSGILLSYVLQGLFHPARKGRKVYWRIYNPLYLGAADALVPFYPDLGKLMFMIDIPCKSLFKILTSFFLV